MIIITSGPKLTRAAVVAAYEDDGWELLKKWWDGNGSPPKNRGHRWPHSHDLWSKGASVVLVCHGTDDNVRMGVLAFKQAQEIAGTAALYVRIISQSRRRDNSYTESEVLTRLEGKRPKPGNARGPYYIWPNRHVGELVGRS